MNSIVRDLQKEVVKSDCDILTALRKAHLVPESKGASAQGSKFSAGFLLFSLALLATFVVLALVLMGII